MNSFQCPNGASYLVHVKAVIYSVGPRAWLIAPAAEPLPIHADRANTQDKRIVVPFSNSPCTATGSRDLE